jgi:signal peptidase I
VIGVLFYSFLIFIVIAALLFNSGANGLPRTFMGYSCMKVLTRSMQSEIPQGSLVITQAVDAESLAVGDNITFIEKNNTTTTHKIVAIDRNYSEDGLPAFKTQGVENQGPDEEMVIAQNVIGKVIFQSTAMGNVLNFVKEYMVFIVALCVLTIGLIVAIKVFFASNKTLHKEASGDDKETKKMKHTAEKESSTIAVQPSDNNFPEDLFIARGLPSTNMPP